MTTTTTTTKGTTMTLIDSRNHRRPTTATATATTDKYDGLSDITRAMDATADDALTVWQNHDDTETRKDALRQTETFTYWRDIDGRTTVDDMTDVVPYRSVTVTLDAPLDGLSSSYVATGRAPSAATTHARNTPSGKVAKGVKTFGPKPRQEQAVRVMASGAWISRTTARVPNGRSKVRLLSVDGMTTVEALAVVDGQTVDGTRHNGRRSMLTFDLDTTVTATLTAKGKAARSNAVRRTYRSQKAARTAVDRQERSTTVKPMGTAVIGAAIVGTTAKAPRRTVTDADAIG